MGTTNTQIIKEVGNLTALVQALCDDQQTTNRLLLGDGQPGALERLTRVEEQLGALDEKVTRVLNGSGEWKGHMLDEKKHGTTLDKKMISMLVGGWSVLYLLFECVPFDKAVSALLKLLGL